MGKERKPHLVTVGVRVDSSNSRHSFIGAVYGTETNRTSIRTVGVSSVSGKNNVIYAGIVTVVNAVACATSSLPYGEVVPMPRFWPLTLK